MLGADIHGRRGNLLLPDTRGGGTAEADAGSPVSLNDGAADKRTTISASAGSGTFGIEPLLFRVNGKRDDYMPLGAKASIISALIFNRLIAYGKQIISVQPPFDAATSVK